MKLTRAQFLWTIAATPAAAQRSAAESWDFLSSPSVFPDIRGTLPRYLNGLAFGLLEKRKQKVARIRSTKDLAERQRYVREHLWTYLGGQPERTPLNARVVGTIDRGDHRLEKVIFESRPGFLVTATLYLPASGAPPYPAILFPLGHESGARSHPSWQRCLVNLTRRGFVCLTWDPLGQGERVQFYDEDVHESRLQGSTVEHTVLGTQCYLLGTNIAQFTIWDGIRALDYLTSRPEVDKSRIGCTGNSGGGTHTSYLSALDDRIQVAAPSCYITSWRRMLESIGPQDAEQILPTWIGDELDYPDYIYAFGTKPFLVLSAIRDFFPILGARASFQEAKEVFTRLGAGDHIAMFEADDGHGYTKPRREAAYRWFTRWLQGAENTEPESPVELLTEQQLNCTPTGQVKTSFPGSADVHSINVEMAEKLRASRRPTAENVRTRARELTHFVTPTGAVSISRFGEISQPRSRVEKFTYESEPGITIPALLFTSAENSVPKPAIVFADARGKAAAVAEAEELAAAGHVVLLPDVRGFGETRPPVESWYGKRSGDYEEDYEHSTTALLIGKNMPGMRALDIVRGIDVLVTRNDVEAKRIVVAGRGAAALPALFAALFDDRIQAVALDRLLVSWDAAVKYRLHQGLTDQVVLSALKHFDLPDVVAALAPRRIALFNSIDPLGHDMPAEQVRAEYSRAGNAYRAAGAANALRIGTRNRDEESLAPIIADLLRT